MRNYRLTLPLIAIISLATFYACNKYTDATPPSNELPEDKLVTASVQGRVLDENDLPVQGATVTSGTATTTTDENGIFNFSDISLSSRFGYVKVAKQGYFTGSRSILTAAGSSSYVTITLIPRTSKGSFAAASGGNVIIETGDTVAFDASSVVNAATNATYSGTVHVYAAYLDPLAKGRAEHMPGDLRGIDSSGKETMLQSFGMMVVELEGDGGEKLQVAAGKQAYISMKIPDALKATAPGAIPLWYFNDTTGKWIEQGAATRQGDQYCGHTSHFTWWNCDAPTGVVNLKVRLKDQHGNPLTYTRIEITSPTFGTTAGYTDATGYVSGLIPKGQTLQLRVVSNCGNVLGGANVGPALADQDLGTLTVNSDIATLTLTGTVVDCGGAAVDSGYVSVVVDGLHYGGTVLKGVFTVNVTRCVISTTSATFVAGDYKTLQHGEVSTISADTGKVDAGQLKACGEASDQYFNTTVNGTTYGILSPPDSIYGLIGQGQVNNIYSVSRPGGSGYSVYLTMPNILGTGDFTVVSFSLSTGTRMFIQNGTPLQCTVTDYGPAGGYVSGNLSGTVKDTTNLSTSYPMTATFKVKRQ